MMRHTTPPLALNLSAMALSLATLTNLSAYAGPLNSAVNTPDPATIDTPFHRVNDMPARYQWNANYGYCGEVSMISAGLYYGQYLSQYDMRAIASPGKKQNREDAQLLLGVNDAQAAQQLRLHYQRMASASDSLFYGWVKHEVAQGYPVITAVFNNEYLLYQDTRPLSGNSEYDHIVSVTGVGSKNPLMAEYDPEDVLLISDHGLYTPDGSAAYFYSLPIEQSLANRKTANMPDGFIYSLPAYPVVKYGIAITGVMDKYAETLPVRVSTSINHETPEIRENSNQRPAAIPLTLSIKVSGLTPGTHYNLYYYKDHNTVPTEHFNENSAKAGIAPWKTFTASSKTWSLALKIQSSEEAFFRVVKSKGP